MPDEIAGAVKDLAFGVNTMTSGKTTFVTEPINGVLEGIFFNSQKAVQLKVALGNTDLVLFEVANIEGMVYIPLRSGVVDGTGVGFPNVADKYPLNDVLIFEVKGPLNTEVNFKVRYC